MLNQLIGCVDGVIENELRGWIINRDYPDRLEQVICRNPKGQELAFRPFTFREDVVRAMSVTGVFGFAIPLDLLASFGPVCSVLDRQGNTLENGADITLPSKSPPCRLPGTLNIFLHISKTAGTSLRNTLTQTVPPGEVLLIYPGAAPGISVARFHQLPLHQRNRLSWVFGHCKFGLDRHVTQLSRYITFIREPLDRLRSNFAHHAAAGTQFEIDGISLRPATVFNDGLSEEFDNVMTRVLAGVGREVVPLGQVGEDEVEIALTNVRRHFAFIGRQSHAAADTLALQSYLKLPLNELTMDNVTLPTSRYDATELAAVDWERVTARNRADLLLYSGLERENLVSRVLG